MRRRKKNGVTGPRFWPVKHLDVNYLGESFRNPEEAAGEAAALSWETSKPAYVIVTADTVNDAEEWFDMINEKMPTRIHESFESYTGTREIANFEVSVKV